MNKLMKGLYGIFIIASLISIPAIASLNQTEPILSVYQGSVPGTSVIEIKWPDGVVDKLAYKDKDVKNGSTGYVDWFQDRHDAYDKRRKEKYDEKRRD